MTVVGMLTAVSVTDEHQFLLLNDLPIEVESLDLLGTSRVAAGLAELVYGSRCQTPFVLSIDGQWGTGKSTLMRQLSNALDQRDDVEVVWFNAWTASGVSALTGMLELVLRRLDRNVVRRSFRRLNSGGLLSGTFRLGVSVAAGFFGVDRAIDQLWDRMAVDANARDEARQLLQNALAAWVDQGTGTPRRTIVVFVDDLDRCSESTAIEIFEVIKLYLDLPGIAFVLGCDLDVLSRIPVPGANGTVRVRHYLEKIVQVNYQVPVPAEATVHAMIEGYAARSRTEGLLTEAMIRLIVHQTGGNPRRIKRLFNSFVAEYQLDPEWREFGAEGLMKVVLLQHFYPDYYQEILRGQRDGIGDLLEYRQTRDWLLRGQRLPEEELAVVEGVLTLHGVPIPPVVDTSYDREECRRSLDHLNSQVPATWRELADNKEFLALLDDLGGARERDQLQRRLRRRPLSTAPTSAQQLRHRQPDLADIRLLWVDDHPVGNESVIDNLTARGAQVRTAEGARTAIELLPHFIPNVLISDVVRNGVEAGFNDLELIRTAGYTGPALFFTSHVTAELQAKAQAAGAAGITASISTVLGWLEERQAEMFGPVRGDGPTLGQQRPAGPDGYAGTPPVPSRPR